MSETPSYKGLQPASEAASHAKHGNRSTDTLHEVLLRRELWHIGLRFRKNVKTLPGKPDIVFIGAKVAVFRDGDFWHGRKWFSLEGKLIQWTNGEYWSAKISTDIERDRRNNALLEGNGWHVIRIWESSIKKDVAAAVTLVREVVEIRNHNKKKSDSEVRESGSDEFY